MTDLPDSTNSSIREAVLNLLSAVAPEVAAKELEETLLIRNGLFCGRRFRVDGWSAIWFGEENQLKIFRPDGTLEHVTQLAQAKRVA